MSYDTVQFMLLVRSDSLITSSEEGGHWSRQIASTTCGGVCKQSYWSRRLVCIRKHSCQNTNSTQSPKTNFLGHASLFLYQSLMIVNIMTNSTIVWIARLFLLSK